MSAAANAAGYLYARGQLSVSDPKTVEAESSPHAAQPRSSRPSEPKVRAPKVEYRKRRLYALPSAA
jgi:hypothetical protein